MSIDFESALRVLSEPVLVVGPDAKVRFANDAACLVLGRACEEVEGSDISALVSPRFALATEEPFHRFILSRSVRTHAPVRAAIARPLRVELEIEATASVLVDESGENIVIVMHQLHLDGEASAERVAAEREQSYRLVFENAPVGIVQFDAGGVITAVNDNFVRIIGSSRRLLIGLAMATLPDEKIVHCMDEVTHGRRAHYEGSYRSTTAAKVTPVRVDFAPVFDGDGAVLGGVGIVEDITERKEAERALQRAERMASLGTLAVGVAHEINTPLAYVMTSLEHVQRTVQLLGDGSKIAADVATPLANALDGLFRVRNIVHDLKSFARPDDDTGGPLDLPQVLEAAIQIAASEIDPRATLVRAYDPTPRVWATESKLVQVFVNLLVNAAQAVGDADVAKNEIRVSLTTDAKGNARVSIRDTGAGIPRENLDRVFEPFFTDKPGSGTGLGLSICHGIVSALDGTIEVQSEARRGSTFTVVLPPAPDEYTGRPSRMRAPSALAPKRTRARIFIIDDEERLAQTIALALSAEHDVEYATRGREAIDKLSADADFDLVLCDLILPDIGGPEIYEAVRLVRPELVKRFVFMTGGAFTERAATFLREIENPRLDKPFPLEDLTKLIDRILA